MRECPASERCLACDSCSRKCRLRSSAASANPAGTYRNMMLMGIFLGWNLWRRTLLQVDDSEMTARSIIAKVVRHEDLNFLLTNRIPRRLSMHFMGWLSRIEQPWVCAVC